MAKAISTFGIYLGSMEPRSIGKCQTWTVFLATDDLALVPHHIEFKVGGMVYKAQVHPRKWIKGQVFERSDLPPTTVPYRPPNASTDLPHIPPLSAATVAATWLPDEDVMPMRLEALREIFRHFSPSELPSDLAACLAGDRQALEVNRAAYRLWKEKNEQWRLSQHATVDATPTDASADQPVLALMPVTSSHSAPPPSRPTTHAASHNASSPTRHPTVHRTAAMPDQTTVQTDHPPSRGKRTQDDLSLQVCNDQSLRNRVQARVGWEPHVLFPESCAPPSHVQTGPILSKKSKGKKVLAPNKATPTHPQRQSSRIKSKKKNSTVQTGLLDIDVQDFLDVPLQQAEGKELLALIGAGNITIPSHIILPSQKTVPINDPGQKSKAQPTNKKQKSPIQDSEAQPVLRQQGLNLSTQQLQETCLSLGTANQNEEAQQVHKLTDEANKSDEPPNDVIKGLDDLEEDLYLDQVDYSDDDMVI